MRHILFSDQAAEVAILAKSPLFNKNNLKANYTNFINAECMAISLESDKENTTTAKFAKAYLNELLPVIVAQGIKVLYVLDGTYFKQLTKQQKITQALGYVFDCAIPKYSHLKVVYGINYQSVVYNPNNQEKLDLSLKALNSVFGGSASVFGKSVIHSADYPKTKEEISSALTKLKSYPHLSADIEAFSLKHYDAGIGTIAFGIDQHNGVAFPCDYRPYFTGPTLAGLCGRKEPNLETRQLLKDFFTTYEGKLRWHGSSYDLKVLIYVLWMGEDPHNTKGLLEGLQVMTRCFEDTMLIAYLALNSCARDSYSLKSLAYSFLGSYAQEEINDIRRIPLSELLTYNLLDVLATNYVYDTYQPKMVADAQLSVYHEIFLPSVAPLIQTELTGVPINMEQVQKAKQELQQICEEQLQIMRNNPHYAAFTELLQIKAMEAKNAKLKKKKHPLSAFSHIQFNPGSPTQLQCLLYEFWELPILGRTKTKEPSTDAKTLKKLLNHVQTEDQKDFLLALQQHSKANKILSTFIPAMERSYKDADGNFWMYGNFKLGGTVSGRLSSSDPNLQNLPSGSVFGKLIKKCVQAPTGWVFGGADFNSLEDYISALTTKDPNKLRVYLDGFDGHCLRAHSYWPEKFPHIQLAEEKHTCYRANVNGTDFYFKENDKLEYDGKTYTGKQFYELASSGGL